MSDYNAEAIELAFVRIYSHSGNQIGLSKTREERKARIRQSIYTHGDAMVRFLDSAMTFSEAFRECYGEGLDRRAMDRPLPEPEGDEQGEDE